MSVPRIRLAVFDWAGTTIDFGSRAPVMAFVQTFTAAGVVVSADEARGPMGLPKREHLRHMFQLPAVAQRWRDVHGRDWTDADLSRLYDEFQPIQLAALSDHNDLIPGVLDCAAQLRQQGIRIGATTGYFRAAADVVREAGRRQGFAPEVSVCVDDVVAGRPAPWMIFRVMEALNVYPPAVVVKVGDTVPDIEEGLNAGVWSVGVTRSSSEVGLSSAELDRIATTAQRDLIEAARTRLLAAGAHATIDELAELPGLVEELNARLQRGEKP